MLYCVWLLQMEGMVTDLQLARDKQDAFKEWLRNKNKSLPVDVSVTVLTTGFWPTYKSAELALPKELAQGVEVFKEFYEQVRGLPPADVSSSENMFVFV